MYVYFPYSFFVLSFPVFSLILFGGFPLWIFASFFWGGGGPGLVPLCYSVQLCPLFTQMKTQQDATPTQKKNKK
jgi:hypothetical protein